MYNYVLFDLDGTLTDSAPGITNSIAYALEKFGITVEDKSELFKFIGPPLKESFHEFYGFNDEECAKAIAAQREYFTEKGMFENSVYDGIKDVLQDLKVEGKKVFLATSKPEPFAITILEHFGLSQYFDFIAGATLDGSRSTKKDVIAHVLKENGITDTKDVVMVGDRRHDIVGAAENNLDSIGVLFGYGNRAELEAAGATHIVKTPWDILTVVNDTTTMGGMADTVRKFGKLYLHELLVLILSAVSVMVCSLFPADTGKTTSSFLSSAIYHPFWPCFLLGFILFLVGYHYIWKKWLLKDFKANWEKGILVRIFVVLVSGAMLGIMFLVNMCALVVVIDLFSTFGNIIDMILIFGNIAITVAYPIGWWLISGTKRVKVNGEE